MKVGKLIWWIFFAPLAVPLSAVRKMKVAATSIKNDIKQINTDESQNTEDANSDVIERPGDWEYIAQKAASRSRLFWILAAAIWLFMGYKIYNGAPLHLIYNLFIFSFILAVFALQSALACAQLRQSRKVKILLLFNEGLWFPSKQ